MAGSARIGALHVALGLDSAQFSAGLKKAKTGLSGFSSAAKAGLIGLAAAATTAAVALGYAVKGAIDHADNLSKTAQKAGLTTEALSRLEWAAKLSDVGLEGLSTGLKKLSQNMLTVAQGAGGTAKLAFDALGISVMNATGGLRNSDEVLAEVADRFSRMEDGATKTALAVQLFGRSGADLIPMLNAGKAGLADMAAESDRLGITISTKSGKAAEEFNDSITRMQAIFDGLVNKIMVGMLPSLNSLSGTLASADFQNAVITTTNFFVGLADALARAVMLAGELANVLPKAVGANEDDWVNENLPLTFSDRDNVGSGAGSFSGMRAIFGAPSQTFVPPIIPIKEMKDEIEITIPRITEMQQAFLDLGTTVESSLSGIMSGLVKDVIKGQDAFGGLIDKVGQLGDKLIDMAFDQAIQGLFGSIMGIFGGGMGMGSGAIGRGVFGGTGGFFPAFPGFEGGGFTGAGARVGGIDGKGGFLATLHPNETVVDHTRGGAGGGLTVNVDARGAQQGVAEQLDQWARFQLPSIIRRHANSTMPENG